MATFERDLKLDQQIATEIFRISPNDCPAYSAEMDECWKVVQRMEDDGWLLSLKQRDTGKWRAMFYTPENDPSDFKSMQETPPLAICKAALKAARS